MNAFQRWFSTLALGASLACAHAGDAAGLSVLGFSKDGRYLAFEQFGVEDGSGQPYAEFTFIDVPGNAYAASRVSIDPEKFADKPLEEATHHAREQAQPALKKLHLDTPESGTRVIYHPLTDISADPHQVRFTPQSPLGGQGHDQYELRLEEADAGQDCAGLGSAKLMTLRVKNIHSGQAKILQQDKRLPASRGCVMRYRIQEVYVYQNQVAVFVNLFSPGFEGENLRFMAVTGTLPKD